MTAARRSERRAPTSRGERRARAPAEPSREQERAPKPALGMLETRGMVTLFEGVDAMLKAATVTLVTWEPVGSGLVSAFVEGEVAAVKAAIDAGVEAAKAVGEVISSLVIPRPHEDMKLLVGKLGPKKAAGGAA